MNLNTVKYREKLPEMLGIILLLSLYFAFFVFVRGIIPDAETLLASIKDLYASYGYYLIFFGALLEATFLVSSFIPGATVVLFGAALSRTGAIDFPIALGLAVTGFVIGYSINYGLGRFGWHHILTRLGLKKGIEIAKNKLTNHQNRAIFFGYFYPSSASFLSTAAGIIGMPFQKFLIRSIIAQLFWGLAWGGLAYVFGLVLIEVFIKYFGFGFILLAIVGLWLVRKRVKK